MLRKQTCGKSRRSDLTRCRCSPSEKVRRLDRLDVYFGTTASRIVPIASGTSARDDRGWVWGGGGGGKSEGGGENRKYSHSKSPGGNATVSTTSVLVTCTERSSEREPSRIPKHSAAGTSTD